MYISSYYDSLVFCNIPIPLLISLQEVGYSLLKNCIEEKDKIELVRKKVKKREKKKETQKKGTYSSSKWLISVHD